jgi:hypothetical protein
MDIEEWLHGLGLQQYVTAFRENSVEAEVLPRLTAEDLKDIGVISVGHRRKLLEAITELRERSAPLSRQARKRPRNSRNPRQMHCPRPVPSAGS